MVVTIHISLDAGVPNSADNHCRRLNLSLERTSICNSWGMSSVHALMQTLMHGSVIFCYSYLLRMERSNRRVLYSHTRNICESERTFLPLPLVPSRRKLIRSEADRR